MEPPWGKSAFIVEKVFNYDRYDAQLQRHTAALEAHEREPTKNLARIQLLVNAVKTSECLRSAAAMLERWDLDPPTLARLLRVKVWDLPTMAHWLHVGAGRLEEMLTAPVVPKDVFITVVVPFVVSMVGENRRHRAWILSVAELVAATVD